MKKLLFIALFSILMAGLGVTASYAGNALPGCDESTPVGPGPTPGVNNYRGVFGAMERHSNLMRLRDKAYTREIVKQSDNGIGMTCFDHAVALSSRLGMIFSDVMPAGTVPTNQTRIWYSPQFQGGTMGADRPLLSAISKVVAPVASGHVDDFGDSLSQMLGATALNFFTGIINGMLTALLAPITALIGAVTTAVGTLNGIMNILMTAMTLLGGIIPMAVPLAVTALKVALQNVLNFITTTLQTAVNAVRTAVTNFLNTFINGPQTSQTSFSNAAGTGECDRIQQLWGNQTPAIFDNGGGNRAIIGTAIETGTAYMNFEQLLGMQAKPGGMTMAAAPMLLGELGLGANAPIIANAAADLTAGQPLGGPNAALPFWPPAPPPFAAGTLPQAIAALIP
ncbi:MAG: hypothetical protein ACAH80_12265 [Alphaproteobacteria bacterium]